MYAQYAYKSLTPFLVERFLQMLELEAVKAEVWRFRATAHHLKIYWQ